MKKLTQDAFDAFVADGNNVVAFSADWCIDCKRVAPFLPELEKKYAETFRFAELDVDDAREVAERYNVKGIPTFIVFRDGEERGRLLSRDAKTKEQIDTFLNRMAEEEKKALR